MRLVTHNVLRCNIRGLNANEGYPLKLEVEKTETITTPFNLVMMKAMLPKIQWPALISALNDLHVGDRVRNLNPEGVNLEDIQQDEEMLRELHFLLFDFHLLDGYLICPTTGRKFVLKDGIPNMILHEDEL